MPDSIVEHREASLPVIHAHKLIVLIVCYRSADLTVDCLRSLENEILTVPGSHVVVCENGTGPESVAELENAINENEWSDWVSLHVIYPNRGFAGGNNAVLREILKWEQPPEYVMLLNSDTIVREGALATLVKAADEHREAGVVGPRLEWPNGDGQISAFRWLTPISEMLSAARTGPLSKMFSMWNVPIPLTDEPIECGWLSFACAIIRRETLQEVGVLDDGYYLYYDDVDYCRRAKSHGWKILHWPEAHVVHLRGRSNPTKELSAQRKRRPGYFYFARNRYFAKFYGRTGLWMTNLLWYVGRTVSLLREIVRHKKPHACEREAIDIWTNWRDPMSYEHVPKQSDEPPDDSLSGTGKKHPKPVEAHAVA